MLILNDVTFRYPGRKGKIAIENITLEFQPGVFYAIFGPSGSGKTTILSLLGGLDVPTNGKVTLDGIPTQQIGGKQLRRNKVSYIFQDFKLFPYMTALENVLVALSISKPELKGEAAREKATETLHSLGLTDDELHRRVSRLSGGQQQRVAIARSLVTDSAYILADEPTGNLDDENTELIINTLRELTVKYHKCVIVVTHSTKVRDAADVCCNIKNGHVSEVVRRDTNGAD